MSSTLEKVIELDSDSQSDGPPTPKKIRLARGDARNVKQKHRKQNYRAEWERDPLCSPWLAPDPKDTAKAVCKWCTSSLVADITLIKKHRDTNKHLKELKQRQNIPPNAMHRFLTSNNKENDFDLNVKDAEIKLCAFLAAHNIPFSAIDDLIPCLKSAFPDSKI